IVSDGWSVAILVRELSHLYAAYSSNRQPRLGELRLQYADFAVWQRRYLTEHVLDQQLSYWKKRLHALTPLHLPTDRPRPPIASHNGERARFIWSQELTSGLKDLARQRGATLFMTLVAGFQALLSRYSRQQDIAIGTDVANRNRSEIEGLIGF